MVSPGRIHTIAHVMAVVLRVSHIIIHVLYKLAKKIVQNYAAKDAVILSYFLVNKGSRI